MPALLADPVTTKRTTKLFSHSIKRFLAWIQGSPVDKNVILRDLLLADLLASFLRSFLAEMWSVLLFLARPYCSYQSNLDGDAVGDPSCRWPVKGEFLQAWLAGHHEGVGESLTLAQPFLACIPSLNLLLSGSQALDKFLVHLDPFLILDVIVDVFVQVFLISPMC